MVKKSFISGIFDAEGSVIQMKDKRHNNGYPRIQFKICSHKITKEIHELLESFGINSKLYHYDIFSMIQINGKIQCKKFHDKIGFAHPIKNQKLRTLL